MENNQENENLNKAEEALEKAAQKIEQDIHQLEEIERRDKEELKEIREEIHEIQEEKKHKEFVDILVNGTPEQVKKGEVSYKEIVTFAFPDFPEHPERSYSVKYKHGPAEKPEGILAPDAKVKVRENMRFDVTFTGQS